ncbi:MAG: DUF3592 domain-containing protein [Alphaproteobacteria bacterium]
MTRLFFLLLFLITLSMPVHAGEPVMPPNFNELMKKATHGDADAQQQLQQQAGRQAQVLEVREARTNHDAIVWLSGTGMAIGFVFLLLGVDMPLRARYWRQHAERTDGKVAGVEIHFNTHKGRTRRNFVTVYRYILSNGREYTGVSDLGQNTSRTGRETGTPVPLLVFPDNPRLARPATAPGSGIGYIIFLVLGAGLFGAAFLYFPGTQTKLIVLGVLALLIASRVMKYARPRAHPFAANDAAASAEPGLEAQAVMAKIAAEGINLYSRQAQDMLRKVVPRRPYYPIEDILKADAEGKR